MTGEIVQMRSAVVSIIDNITCMDFGTACADDGDCAAGQVCGFGGTCIEDPSLSSCVFSVWTGVGTYFGTNDSYRNLLSLQEDSRVTQSRIPGSATGAGADEALFESISCVCNPAVCTGAGCLSPLPPDRVGCPGFRRDAVSILVTITDEQDECTTCSSDSASAAGGELMRADVTFVGVDADAGHEPRTDLRAIATAAGSFDRAGAPLVVEGDGPAVRDAVTSAINEIVEGVPIRVTIEAADEPGDDGDALQFIDRLEVNTTAAGCTAVMPLEDTDGDGFMDAFPALTPGTPVCWDVVARMNTTVMPASAPLVFLARLTVRGDGSPLDDRRVFFLVPPHIEPPGGPD